MVGPRPVGPRLFGSRRDVIKGAGLGLGSAFLAPALLTPVSAEAAALRVPASPIPTGTEKLSYWSAEYWAHKGAVDLYMYRKRRAAPLPGAAPLPILFLVHGSSISSRPTFDLAVPGKGEYSLMNVFAALGYDVWTMDHEGYGRSSRTEGNSDIASGAADLQAAAIVLERETGLKRYQFFGESSGALRACAYAELAPERVGGLMLSALTYTGKGSPTLGKRAEQVEFFRSHNRRPRGRDMILSIFTRDKPGTSDPAVGPALADAELKFGDTCPTGTYLDMTANLPVVDPKKIAAPALVARGEYDGIATVADLVDFYTLLPSADRQLIVIPGAAHSLVLSLNRRLLWHVMYSFLTMPHYAKI